MAKSPKKCTSDKIRNPATNRCVKKTGKIGKSLLKKSPPKKSSPKKSVSISNRVSNHSNIRSFQSMDELERWMSNGTHMRHGMPVKVRVGDNVGEVRYYYMPENNTLPVRAYTPAEWKVVSELFNVYDEMIREVRNYVQSLSEEELDEILENDDATDIAEAVILPFSERYKKSLNTIRDNFMAVATEKNMFISELINDLIFECRYVEENELMIATINAINSM